MDIALLLLGIAQVGLLAIVLVALRRGGGDPHVAALQPRLDELQRNQGRIESVIKEELAMGRRESSELGGQLRRELGESHLQATGTMMTSLEQITQVQQAHLTGITRSLHDLSQANEIKLEHLRATVDLKLSQIQTDNAQRLEVIRQTVDERLQGTLEARLGESFKLVRDQLDQVHVGLGQMRELATGVGDLKRVLTNVRTRGTWGEVLLGSLLEQVLTAEQFERNVAPKPHSGERVEYAIKLPGRDHEPGHPVWLPIDSKFPKEDYERLQDAAERADAPAIEEAAKKLEARIRTEARSIHDKYIEPPHTTDFAILFLPTEGLYAEVLRRPGLVEEVQRTCRVCVAGPTTLAAMLNSLQMGFRTLAIEKRSSDVWKVLSDVKTEFGRFGEVMEKVKKKLQEASHVVESVDVRTRAMDRKLRNVEMLPDAESRALLGTERPSAADAPPSFPGSIPD